MGESHASSEIKTDMVPPKLQNLKFIAMMKKNMEFESGDDSRNILDDSNANLNPDMIENDVRSKVAGSKPCLN